jgi:hypothetical protein
MHRKKGTEKAHPREMKIKAVVAGCDSSFSPLVCPSKSLSKHYLLDA